MPVVLIVSHSNDVHVNAVLPFISHQDIQVFRLDADRFPRDYQFCFRYTADGLSGDICCLITGLSINVRHIAAVWLRKPAPFQFCESTLSEQEQAFAAEETEHTLLGLLYSLECYWVNHPMQLRGAMWKTEQLQRAARYGFTIPASLVTNLPDSVSALADSSERGVIFKALSSSWLGADLVSAEQQHCRGLPTTLLSEQDLSDLSSVSIIPCHFQHYIAKDYELRVTVIAGQVFAARVDSQQDDRTKIDSRDLSANVTYSEYQLDAALQQRVLAFVHSYGLNYSALDFIVTPEQQLVFLENNPNGQFLYIEQLVPALELCRAMADLLVGKALCPH